MEQHYEINFYNGDTHYLHMSAFKSIKEAKENARRVETFHGSRVTVVDWYGCRTVAEKLPNHTRFRNYN